MGQCRGRNLAVTIVGVLAAAIVVGATDPGALEAKIVYPPGKSLFTGDGKIEVRAFRPSAGPGNLVLSRGGGAEELPVGEGVVRVPVALQPGVNTLRLDGEAVEVFLEGSGAWQPPAGFEIPDAHAAGIGCEDCHRFENGQAQLLEPGGKLCARCHDDVKKVAGGTPVLHPPVEEGDCFACHSLHGAAIVRLSATASRALCLGCHDDPAKAPEGKDWPSRHRALDKGCLPCHAPHASAVPGLLKGSQGVLCAGCHRDKGLNPAGAKWATPHAPVAKGECTSCHGPHGATYRKLLTRSGNGLCLDCHQQMHKFHRSVKDDWPRATNVVVPEGFPLSSTGEFFCGGCHLPHGSDHKRLFIRPEEVLCRRCHRNY